MKTQKRLEVLEAIIQIFKNDVLISSLNFDQKQEGDLKDSIFFNLLVGLKRYFHDKHPDYKDATIERKANRAVTWEGHKLESISPTWILGVSHRPDYVIDIIGIRIAVEIKKADDGSSIREMIGQSIVYSREYDFVIGLIIDITKDAAIISSVEGENETALLDELWEQHNIRFEFIR